MSDEKNQEQQEQQTQQNEEELQYIVRVANTDLPGDKPLYYALTKIKGVSFMFSNMICNLLGIDKFRKAGTLKEDEIEKINDFLKNPKKYNAPSWMLNRRKDYETGEDLHIIGPNIKLTVQNDIRRLIRIKAYRGIRHMLGLPVRGQRTKSNFRKNKGKVLGVKRSKNNK